MYTLDDGALVLSASDLTNHLACPHLTQVKLAVARGERRIGRRSESPHAELLRGRGEAHEREQLGVLAEAAGGFVDLGRESERDPATGRRIWPPRRAWLEAGHASTVQAMREGAPLIFQAPLFDGRWQGIADFLRRIDLADARDEREAELIAASELGDYAYEVLDSKLAKQVRPYVVHQLSLYSALIGRIQGVELPRAHVVGGDGEQHEVELGRYAALHRRVVRRFEQVVARPTEPTSFPEPCDHCSICDLEAQCDEQLRGVDHLSFVARANRSQRALLEAAGVSTLEALATTAPSATIDGLDAARLERLRTQAALQLRTRTTQERTRHHLVPERAAGYALLPEPDPADLFFDFEGDPYVGPEGLEYLWGWSSVEGGVPLPGLPPTTTYDSLWAHDEPQERDALERFVGLLVERRAAHPGMHVYHYSAVERSTLLKLAMRFGTCEAELDQLVRDGVFVDLYAVVGRALLVGEESYSLKRLERHHGFVREERTVRDGGGSVVAYEQWLEERRPEQLTAIRDYNEEDCRSTASLRDWLWGELRPEAAAEHGVDDWAALRHPEPTEERGEPPYVAPLEERRAKLHAGLPEEPGDDDADQAERRLLGELLLFHRREEKPQWWEQFRLAALSPEELVEEREALGCLSPVPGAEPEDATSLSFDYRMAFPPQEFKVPKPKDLGQLADAAQVTMPKDERAKVTVQSVDLEAGELVLRRQKKFADRPLPRALINVGLPPAEVLRDALAEVADALLDGPADRFPAARALLRREPPRLRSGGRVDVGVGVGGGVGVGVGGGVDAGDRVEAAALGESTEALCAATLALDHSVLPVQGPPGTGKTYNAARMIVAALNAGLRVGITAQSHAAVRNVLAAVEAHAAESGARPFRGFYKGDPDEYASRTGWVHVEDDNKPAEPAGKDAPPEAQLADPDLPQLLAGTAWLFARPTRRRTLDLLFVDEAGQFSLANACAVATAADSLVLLGDPQQLPQVNQGSHPPGADASVLQHMLAGAPTIPPERGVLLTTTWRMHPAITGWVSDTSYEGRLEATADCAARRVQVAGEPASVESPASPSTAARAFVALAPGAGLSLLEVPHEGRSQSSPEEADAIAQACRLLLDGGTVTEPARNTPAELRAAFPPDPEGLVTRPLRPADLMVVAPYNLAVQAIGRAVPEGVRVGTVDKFQGQEAPVVFYALTCSSADDVPRGLDFLFDPNRLNVAISRAQALAILVHSPRLLDADCKTLPAMARASGVCGLVERAGASGVLA